MNDSFVLQMENITKEYYGNTVLKDVSLSIKKGEIHALLGENGAGKSTLMNILFGMGVIHSTGGFTGDVYLDGQKTQIQSPLMAMEYGIGMVHQEFMLIPGFTIAENIKIGREISRPNFISRILGKKLEMLDYPAMAADARKSLDKVGLGIDEYTKVAGMPVGYMQFVEIAREIDKTGIKILVFDEPTAVLTESEAERLLETMKNIAASGIAIIFITHRLDEVMSVCDNVTILRDGQLISAKAVADSNVRDLAALMVGREVEISAANKRTEAMSTEPALELKDFHVHMEGEEVRGLDLTINKGEIFGIGGLAGQGKIGVCNGIMGMCEASGSVKVFGNEVTLNKLGDALNKKVAFVSEDRRGVGLLLDESIADNIAFTAIQVNQKFLLNMGIGTQVSKSQVNAYAEDKIKELDIRCTGPRQSAGRLSGGNQQKVCLARALALEPDLLMVAEPTRGIDIGAKKLVLDTLTRLNKEDGVTVIMVSSELAELRSICDRISIITDGKLAAILEPNDSDANFGLAMSGTKLDNEGDESGGDSAGLKSPNSSEPANFDAGLGTAVYSGLPAEGGMTNE